jgi:hypothetical protein
MMALLIPVAIMCGVVAEARTSNAVTCLLAAVSQFLWIALAYTWRAKKPRE